MFVIFLFGKKDADFGSLRFELGSAQTCDCFLYLLVLEREKSPITIHLNNVRPSDLYVLSLLQPLQQAKKGSQCPN